MNLIEKGRLLLQLKRLDSAINEETKMGHDWTKTARAAFIDLMLTTGAVMCAYFSDPAALAAALGVLPEQVRLAAIPLLSALFVAGRKWFKHRQPSARDVKVVGLILLTLVASPAVAQDPGPPKGEISLWAGSMRFAERGQPDKIDFVYRVSAYVNAPSGAVLWARGDWTRTQDGGDLTDIKTFRSLELHTGVRKEIAPGLSATGFSGVTWNRDDAFEPADPRLWTAAAGLRYDIPKRGYLQAAAGHHGPVGGSAFLGSVVWTMSENTSWFGDVAIPLDATRFNARPYTVKFGLSAKLKGKELR